ncbi:MAG: hypothetical protein QGG25_07005, partial [Phycisphaerae bacterium]|nr:hypothetical protein [Phycisphaerae bacterium]
MKTSDWRIYTVLPAICLTVAVVLSAVGGCGPKKSDTDPDGAAKTQPATRTPTTQPAVAGPVEPCVTPIAATQPATSGEPCTTQGAPAPKVMPADPG